jgi:integrase
MSLDAPTRSFRKLIERHNEGNPSASLPAITLHGLRHTAATLLIVEAGADPKTAQALLGHSSSRTTMNIYTHALESAQRRSADAMGGLLAPAQKMA